MMKEILKAEVECLRRELGKALDENAKLNKIIEELNSKILSYSEGDNHGNNNIPKVKEKSGN